jgi:SpoVK/Ycf46/Vps4 family AAA+-type ATPase
MPQLSSANAARFASLRREAANALTRVNAARKAARQAGRFEDERRLVEAREEIREAMRDIDEAEDAFERSSMSVAAAEARLRGAVGSAKDAVKAMQGIASTLAKVAEILGLMRRLVLLFG